MNFISVNYHSIDDEDKYKSGIYPISADRFAKQLELIKQDFVFISEDVLVSAIENKTKLPDNACLITFDDALRSQYENAVPILREMKIPAVFFINTLHLKKEKACVVHKIWKLLSMLSATEMLAQVIRHYSEIKHKEINFDNISLNSAQKENMYDHDTDTLKLKYLLNSYLDLALVELIIDKIFAESYGDEKDFCQEFYMDAAQIKDLDQGKLFSIGLHTESHLNIPHAENAIVSKEIISNHDFLKNNLDIKNIQGISYPIGAIEAKDLNDKIMETIKSLEIKYGVTVQRRVNHDLASPFLIHRFDTNDVDGGKNPIIDLKNIIN
jgi:peptidoglycan/xylan/chitin deacetylase (PgdA/CDA1 family)